MRESRLLPLPNKKRKVYSTSRKRKCAFLSSKTRNLACKAGVRRERKRGFSAREKCKGRARRGGREGGGGGGEGGRRGGEGRGGGTEGEGRGEGGRETPSRRPLWVSGKTEKLVANALHAEQNLQPCVHWIVLAEIQRRRSALTEWSPSNKPENKNYLLLLTTKYLTAGYWIQCNKDNRDHKQQEQGLHGGENSYLQKLYTQWSEPSIRAVTRNTFYGWARLMLWVIKVESQRWHYKFLWDIMGKSLLLWLLKNLMTALWRKWQIW